MTVAVAQDEYVKGEECLHALKNLLCGESPALLEGQLIVRDKRWDPYARWSLRSGSGMVA